MLELATAMGYEPQNTYTLNSELIG